MKLKSAKIAPIHAVVTKVRKVFFCHAQHILAKQRYVVIEGYAPHSTVAVIEITISRELWQTYAGKLSSDVTSAAICTREGPIDFPKGLVSANLLTPCMYLTINASLGGCLFSVQGDVQIFHT